MAWKKLVTAIFGGLTSILFADTSRVEGGRALSSLLTSSTEFGTGWYGSYRLPALYGNTASRSGFLRQRALRKVTKPAQTLAWQNQAWPFVTNCERSPSIVSSAGAERLPIQRLARSRPECAVSSACSRRVGLSGTAHDRAEEASPSGKCLKEKYHEVCQLRSSGRVGAAAGTTMLSGSRG